MKSSFERRRIDIQYSQKPPNFEVGDISNNNILAKLAGYKSKRWEYEKEVRIITDKWGRFPYDYSAVRSIYFGLRMKEENIFTVMERLQGRGIQYYKMELVKNSYNLSYREVEDPFDSDISYMKKVPKEISKGEKIHFEIIDKKHKRGFHKGEITIKLNVKVEENVLLWIGKLVKDDIFKDAKIVSMFYRFENQESDGIAWATSHYDSEKGVVVRVNEWVN